MSGAYFAGGRRNAAGLPTIHGTVFLADATYGIPLAVMESGSITMLRTGAATAVAAKFLARPESRTGPSWGVACRARFSSPPSKPSFPWSVH